MRLTFVCRAFHNISGGVERMSTLIMNEMAERGHQVSLITRDEAGATPFYQLSPIVDWRCLDMGPPDQPVSHGVKLQRMARFRSFVRDLGPELLVGFQHGPWFMARIATLGLGVPSVVAERNAPSMYDHVSAGRKRKRIMHSFHLANMLTVQFESHRDGYPASLQPRIRVIPNPVLPARAQAAPADAKGPQPSRTLLAVGRLSYQKNFESLLMAFSQIMDDHPSWHLKLLGAGEKSEKILQLADSLGLNERLAVCGPVHDVGQHYASAHLFCMPSRWEGFPNALAEAMAHGLPAVGFAGCDGVNDLINHGVDGLLAPGNGDASALAQALSELMADDSRRASMGLAASDISNLYQPSRIFDLWESLFHRALSSAGHVF